MGFPSVSEVKASASNAGDLGSIPGLGRSPGEGNGTPLQYSCLENPMDGGVWWATVHGVAELDTTGQSVSAFTDTFTLHQQYLKGWLLYILTQHLTVRRLHVNHYSGCVRGPVWVSVSIS